MARLRVHNFSMSLDGFTAGPRQTLEEPLGVGGESLHDWMFETRFWHRMQSEPGGTDGVDNAFAEEGVDGIGATVMGRNMFGPVRGPWPDETWRGWWGEDPPYHHPVFVLTHHARPPLEMSGGTTFHFVTDGIEAALQQAYAAAAGADVRLGGGASVVRQYLAAGLLDDLHVPVVPILLGDGERLFADGAADGYEVVESVPSDAVLHVRLRRKA